MNKPIDFNKLDFYSFFTKYSLMDEYGFSYGLLSRMFRKLLPIVPPTNTVEYHLLNNDIHIPELVLQLDSTLSKPSNIQQKVKLRLQLKSGLQMKSPTPYTFSRPTLLEKSHSKNSILPQIVSKWTIMKH